MSARPSARGCRRRAPSHSRRSRPLRPSTASVSRLHAPTRAADGRDRGRATPPAPPSSLRPAPSHRARPRAHSRVPCRPLGRRRRLPSRARDPAPADRESHARRRARSQRPPPRRGRLHVRGEFQLGRRTRPAARSAGRSRSPALRAPAPPPSSRRDRSSRRGSSGSNASPSTRGPVSARAQAPPASRPRRVRGQPPYRRG